LCNEEKEELEEDAMGEGVKDVVVHPEDSKYSWVVWDGEHYIGICSPVLQTTNWGSMCGGTRCMSASREV
jgi:hypothetical protein